ncbi:hypothetical protein Salat_2959400 [Sesamum alatum]|uniref:Uncharacterized protein n=1 Tax=Sesamum alatum TaxID=300844 RepID=A0AAE1XJM1_9LAMI|nr:hypothetical protein Salat_2959400 [Sesamum alatum]
MHSTKWESEDANMEVESNAQTVEDLQNRPRSPHTSRYQTKPLNHGMQNMTEIYTPVIKCNTCNVDVTVDHNCDVIADQNYDVTVDHNRDALAEQNCDVIGEHNCDVNVELNCDGILVYYESKRMILVNNTVTPVASGIPPSQPHRNHPWKMQQ